MATLTDTSSAKQGVALTAGAGQFETTRAVYVAVAGSATVTFSDGGSIAFAALPVGLLPFCIKNFTAGTATLVGLY